MKTINDFDEGDLATDGQGNFATVKQDTNAPYKMFYANTEEPENEESAEIVPDFYEDHLEA